MTRESLYLLYIENILYQIDKENTKNNNQYTNNDEKKSSSKFQIQINSVDPDTETKTESDEDEEELPHLPSMQDSISVERFKKLLESTNEKYDIQEIVNELTPNGSDHELISFTDIASYHKPISCINV